MRKNKPKPQMDTDKHRDKNPVKNYKPRMNTDEHSRKCHPEFSSGSQTTTKKEMLKQVQHDKRHENPLKNIDDIVNDFGDRVMKGENITIDDVLKQYPKLAKKLKPLLEIEMMLIKAGQEFRKQTEKEMAEHKEQLWKKLEKMILEKQKQQIEAQVQKVKTQESVPVKFRSEFIPMLLYVKGKRNRIGEGIRGITRFIKLFFLLAKETELTKLVKPFYDFVPYKIGPFEPAIYQDLKVLEMAGIIKKQTYSYSIPSDEKQIDEGFNQNNVSTLYTLTDEGMKYAKALISWLDKKDPEIALKLRRYKTYYAQAPLKKLLEYIYKKYPDYTTESEIIKKIIH